MDSERSYRCPKCGYEYQPWVKTCPDCGTPIELRAQLRVIKGDLADDDDPRWTRVTIAPNAILGSFMKSQLEQSGIPVLMFRTKSADVAQFSHNDFVPQDLLVPRDRLREARQLIDSAPGDEYGPHPLEAEDFDEAGDDLEGPAGDEADLTGEIPEGWSMLPTEADLAARQEVRRTHGKAIRGWYWSEKDGVREAPAEPAGQFDDDQEFADEPWKTTDLPRDEFAFAPKYSDPYGGYSGREWTKPSRWIKIVYGILLLVMSLPFLLQLLGNIWEALHRLP